MIILQCKCPEENTVSFCFRSAFMFSSTKRLTFPFMRRCFFHEFISFISCWFVLSIYIWCWLVHSMFWDLFHSSRVCKGVGNLFQAPMLKARTIRMLKARTIRKLKCEDIDIICLHTCGYSNGGVTACLVAQLGAMKESNMIATQVNGIVCLHV